MQTSGEAAGARGGAASGEAAVFDCTGRGGEAGEAGRCSVANCTRPAVVAYRMGAFFDERCLVHATFPSARACLLAGLAIRSGQPRGWSVYPTGYGNEYDLYPGDEGPQRELGIEEVLDGIGGDQGCTLAPAGRDTWPTLDETTRQQLLAGISPNGSAEPERLSESARNVWMQMLDQVETAILEVQRLVDTGKVSAAAARPIRIALENDRHECTLKAL